MNTVERREGEQEEEDGNVLDRTLSAGYWSFLDTIMQKVLIYGAFFITARLLSPADFGTVALAMVFPNLLDSLTALAFDTALTQKPKGDERQYLHVVWTLNFLRSVVVAIIIFFSSFLVVKFFHIPDALLLFQLSALPVLFQGMTSIGQIYFFRELDFKKVFIRDLANYATAAILTVLLALSFHSYWAIFIGNTAGIFMAGVMTYVLNPYRPHLDLKFAKLKPLLTYSEWIFGQALSVRLTQTLEDTLVGHFTTTTNVGNFSKAKSLAYAPTSPLSNIISKIGFSALVATGGSLPHVHEGFHKSFDIAVLVAIPFIVVIWLAGDTLVYIVLGKAWMGIVPLLKILVIVSALNTCVQSIAGMTFNAINKPQYFFRLSALSLASAIIFLPYLVTTRGINGAALSLLISAIIVNCYALYLLRITITPVFSRIIETTLVTLGVASIPIPLIIYSLEKSSHSLIIFFTILLLYGVCYLFGISISGILLKKGPYATLFVIINSFESRLPIAMRGVLLKVFAPPLRNK